MIPSKCWRDKSLPFSPANSYLRPVLLGMMTSATSRNRFHGIMGIDLRLIDHWCPHAAVIIAVLHA